MATKTSHHDDPRDESLETKHTLPKTWSRENYDALQSSGLILSGLIMVTRNRYLAWPAILFGISSLINQHPLRTKNGGGSPLSGLSLCVTALIASYMPLFVITSPTSS